MGSLLGLIGNLFTGGGLGVIGGLFQKGIDAWQANKERALEIEEKKLDQAHEIDMQREARESMKLEIEGKLSIARVEGDTQIKVADTAAMAAAMAADKRTYASDAEADKYPFMMVLVDFLRGVIRPGLTIYLNVAASVIVGVATFYLYDAWLHGGIDAASFKDTILAIVTKAATTILFLAEVATCFWFVTRPSSSRGADQA